MKQLSTEWHAMRVGKVTASRIIDVINFRKDGKEGADRKNYAAELICEILTGRPAEHYVSTYMEHGNEYEQDAVTAYEMAQGVMVDPAEFYIHPEISRAGASPDRLVGDAGLLECKCPKTETHIRWLLADEVPEEHRPQMFFQMACTGRTWCDFASYCPWLPPNLQLFTKRLHWHANTIVEIEAHVQAFIAQLDGVIEEMVVRFGKFEIPQPQVLAPDRYEEMAMLQDEDFEGLVGDAASN